jgi:hypothetical protein
MRNRLTICIIVSLLVGAGVAVGVTKLRTPVDRAVQVDGYVSLPLDQGHLTVRLTLGYRETFTLVQFDERSTEIVVTVRVRDPGGSHTDIGLYYWITTPLIQPIGGRTIVDGSSGKPVRAVPN